jgi:antitoxin ParD1/3/4
MSSGPTTTLNISLPKPLKDFVEQQTATAGYTSASEFIRELIRAARRYQAQQHRLETLLLEGMDSGACINADDDYWTAKTAKLRRRWADLAVE